MTRELLEPHSGNMTINFKKVNDLNKLLLLENITDQVDNTTYLSLRFSLFNRICPIFIKNYQSLFI